MVFRRRPAARTGHGWTPLERYSFHLYGYHLFEGVLDQPAIERLRSAIEAQRLPPADETIERQRFGSGGQLFAWDRMFCDLVDHPLVISILKELIGPQVRLDHAYGITMRPGTSGLGLHGPAYPYDPAQYYVHRMGMARSGLLSFSWSLSEAGPGAGGFGCVPGSHRMDEPLPEGAEWLVVEVPQPAGSLLVFTEALAHCTIRWQGPDTRWAVLYKYSPGNSAWDPSPPAPRDVLASMTPRQRLFFQPPSVGGRAPTLG